MLLKRLQLSFTHLCRSRRGRSCLKPLVVAACEWKVTVGVFVQALMTLASVTMPGTTPAVRAGVQRPVGGVLQRCGLTRRKPPPLCLPSEPSPDLSLCFGTTRSSSLARLSAIKARRAVFNDKSNKRMRKKKENQSGEIRLLCLRNPLML